MYLFLTAVLIPADEAEIRYPAQRWTQIGSCLTTLGASSGALEEQNSLGTQEETRQVAFPKELMRSKQSTDASVETAGNNSLLEAEAAEHAVNYHRVRRRVQEDIRHVDAGAQSDLRPPPPVLVGYILFPGL